MTTTPDSPAAELRQAAKLLRERASEATPGPWKHMCLGSEGCVVMRASGTIRERGPARGTVARFGWKECMADHADAVFVATMSPPVAALLADLLGEVAADRHASLPQWVEDAALAVARAVLGGAR